MLSWIMWFVVFLLLFLSFFVFFSLYFLLLSSNFLLVSCWWSVLDGCLWCCTMIIIIIIIKLNGNVNNISKRLLCNILQIALDCIHLPAKHLAAVCCLHWWLMANAYQSVLRHLFVCLEEIYTYIHTYRRQTYIQTNIFDRQAIAHTRNFPHIIITPSHFFSVYLLAVKKNSGKQTGITTNQLAIKRLNKHWTYPFNFNLRTVFRILNTRRNYCVHFSTNLRN